MVGWVVGRSARWVVWPSQVVVVLVYGRFWNGWVGWWGVVVVGGVVLEGGVVVVVGVLVVVVVVVELVVVVVLWVGPQDPLVFRWDVGVGHRLQPLGSYGLVESGVGFGVGLGEDPDGGVPRPRVGLAGGGGGLSGMDGGALGDRDVAEVLDGVLLCCCLRGGGSCMGQGGVACSGRGILVAGTLLALLPLLWLLGVSVVSLVMLVVLVVLLLALEFRLWLVFGLGHGNRIKVVEVVVLEMWGERCRAGLLLPGRWGRPRAGRGASGRRVCGCGFGFPRGLVDGGG